MIIVPNPPAPGTTEWQRLITASKMAGILGVSPWASPRSVWLDMTQGREPEPATAPMLRGTFLEDGMLDWFEHDHPELDSLGRQTAVTQEDMPWALATLDGRYYHLAEGQEIIVEVKTASRLDDWQGEDGGLVVPAYYEAQVRFQLALASEAHHAILVLLTPFLEKVELVIERDDELDGAVLEAAWQWHHDLEAGIVPELDDSVATYEAVRREHPDIDPDAEVELDHNIAYEWLEARADLKHIEARERGAKTALLDAMGNAKTATYSGRKIATRTPGARGSVTLRAAAKLTDIDPF